MELFVVNINNIFKINNNIILLVVNHIYNNVYYNLFINYHNNIHQMQIQKWKNITIFLKL